MTPSAVSGEDNVATFLRRLVRVLLVLVAVLDCALFEDHSNNFEHVRVRVLLEIWLLQKLLDRGVVRLAVLVLLERVQLD